MSARSNYINETYTQPQFTYESERLFLFSSHLNPEPNHNLNTAALPFKQKIAAPVEDLEELISEMKGDD